MINRREFIAGLCAGAVLSIVGSRAWSIEKQNWIIFGAGKDFHRLDPLTGELATVATPTMGHSFLTFPGQSDLVVGLEKWNRSLSVVDFSSNKLVQSIEPEKNRHFYGHILFEHDGKHFISPQMNLKNNQGYLVWYDRETLKIVDEMVFKKGGSHDLVYLPGTDIAAVTTSGLIPDYDHPSQGPSLRVGPSTIAFVDMKKKAIVKEWELENQGSFPGHLKVSSRGRVHFDTSVFSKYKGPGSATYGGVYDCTLDQPIREWEMPPEVKASLKSELLSIEINESLNRLAVTNPSSQQLITFDLTARKFLGITHAVTTGIAWDSKRSVLYGIEPKAPNQSEKLNGFTYQHLASNGMSSHILFV